MPTERIDDRRFPRGSVTAQTGHELCLDRWLEERSARELAERSIRENAQAYEALSEARDKEIERLRRRVFVAWLTAASVCVIGWAGVTVGLWAVFHR